jgi:hypothetical protein
VPGEFGKGGGLTDIRYYPVTNSYLDDPDHIGL